MRLDVRDHLLKIADDFREFLGVDDLALKDITLSGSNAAYTYTPHSDIDLHLVVNTPDGKNSDVYKELFDAKKYQYNDQHNYKIGGYDVELYVQDADQVHHSQGIYSVLNNDWVSVPRRRRPEVDDMSVRSKFEDIGHRIEQAIASGDSAQIAAIAASIALADFKNDKVVKTQVEVGIVNGDSIEVKSGVQEHALIAASNINTLKDGDTIVVTK